MEEHAQHRSLVSCPAAAAAGGRVPAGNGGKALALGLGLAMSLAGNAHTATAQSGAECRQALALGHDVSGSVSRREYDLQMNGLAAALLSADVQQAFLALPPTIVRLYVYEWSGPGTQVEILPWTDITAPDDLRAVAALLRAPANRPRSTGTALGEGMLFGAGALAAQPDCWRRTLDISGDGRSNLGPSPRMAALGPLMQGITVNALVIASEAAASDLPERTDSAPGLTRYFRQNVIQGPDAFVEVAVTYEDYARAIERKLLKELQNLVVGALVPAGAP